jgi:hypothetical protein
MKSVLKNGSEISQETRSSLGKWTRKDSKKYTEELINEAPQKQVDPSERKQNEIFKKKTVGKKIKIMEEPTRILSFHDTDPERPGYSFRMKKVKR